MEGDAHAQHRAWLAMVCQFCGSQMVDPSSHVAWCADCAEVYRRLPGPASPSKPAGILSRETVERATMLRILNAMAGDRRAMSGAPDAPPRRMWGVMTLREWIRDAESGMSLDDVIARIEGT
jgi:hypothetical protein